MSKPPDPADQEDDAPIVPVRFTDDAMIDDEAAAARAKKFRRAGIVAVAAVVFIVALSVVFVLPRYVAPTTHQATAPAPESSDAATEATPAPSPALEPEVATALRRENQAQLETLLELAERLKQRNVDVWASEEFEAAAEHMGEGEQAYREQRYDDAGEAYNVALSAMQDLEARTPEVVATAIEEGFLHIESRDSGAAEKSFRFALAIEPENERAQLGLARASTLDQVLALVNEAAGYEDLGDTDEALKRYGEALALDGDAPGASSAVARITQQKLDTLFSRAMSDGLAAYAEQENSRAKTAFERALKLRPGAREAVEALAQVENRILADRISAHLRKAAASERGEKWATAATEYRRAAKLDAELDGATASAAHADKRAKLDNQIESILAKPGRLNDDRVAASAEAVLKRARSQGNAGPRLSSQISRLDQTIRQARTPIAVNLVSDNLTEVTLYKVGALGRFEQRAVSILPGRYVVVGKRDGFRDVRVEFNVSATDPDSMITVRCEQKLAFGS